jgi:hypothetical protein
LSGVAIEGGDDGARRCDAGDDDRLHRRVDIVRRDGPEIHEHPQWGRGRHAAAHDRAHFDPIRRSVEDHARQCRLHGA